MYSFPLRPLASFAIAVLLAVLPVVTVAAETESDPVEPESIATSDPQEQEPQPVSDDQQVVLDEITVTAQRREENIQQVPVAVSVLDEAAIDLITIGGAADVRALSARTPSLLLESSFGRAFPRFYIRGLGNTDFDLNASQPVSMVYDEIVLENPVLKGMPIFDMERIEVLRGPQGSLFGRNTPAGVVKFDSKKPTDEFEAMVRGSYGTYGTTAVQGVVSGPFSDAWSGRLSVIYQGREDWVDNGFTGERNAVGGYSNAAIRGQLQWKPNDNFTGLLNLHSWDVDGTARLFRANMIEQGSNRLVGGFEADTVYHDGQNSQDISAQGGALNLSWDFGPATLTSVTGFETLDMFSRGDIDGGFGAVFAPPSGPGTIPFPSESADGLPSLDQFTQEIRVTKNDDGSKLGWLAGAFYFDESLQADTYSFDTLAGGAQDGFSFQRQDAESWALFGSLWYDLTERLRIQGGLRYTDDQKDFSAERPDPTFQTPTSSPIVRKTSVDFTNWDLSLFYEVSDAVNVYGRAATGSRAPSIQGRILFCADFDFGQNPATNCVSVADQEDLTSFEVGVKSELLDRRLRLNATVYTFEVDGQQIVAVGGEFNTATLLNADKTEGYGFEVDMAMAFTQHWQLTMGLSNNNTEIKDDELGVAPCGGGCTVLDPIIDGLARVDGNRLPHAPEWIFNGILDYRRPVGSGLFVGSFDWAYHDDKSFFLYDSVEFRSDFFELGARFGYVFGDGRYEASIWGRNLADEIYVKNGIDFNNLTGMINDPRTLGVDFIAKFF